MKQTAVELLINYIETQNKNGYEFHPKYNEEIINQSKELEKQQIIDAVNSQRQLGWDEKREQYYNETFNK